MARVDKPFGLYRVLPALVLVALPACTAPQRTQEHSSAIRLADEIVRYEKLKVEDRRTARENILAQYGAEGERFLFE